MQMSVLEDLIRLEEKEFYIPHDKMPEKKCLLLKNLVLGKGNFPNQEYSITAYVHLAPKVIGKTYLPSRYAVDPVKRLTQPKIDEIHNLQKEGRKFYIVKHGTHAGSADIDLIVQSGNLPYPEYDGK